ncbi:transcriptional regulator, AbrB family [Desulfotomaculum nigrificans CO-1-SRB]|uniref:Transcriptional regulator, AbrB family n=1 Tax=Desulfotomaculum nigrificans (strain DSM 14880 / VKM B-2319 / CO-1-SRB) TaxID=868595 RepID=F6B945_DESCC|nr:AbrB/MazE/SpoVT family DNA-binding domain-containing protein [Desulfotomaculum nigrificans]AEF94817.1 transcriptional regulator, AbrB family [Desulfotomaculum nigrificans CO-1-SRB]
MYNVKVSSRGQIVIPVEARNRLNLKEGDTLSVYIEGEKIILKTKVAKTNKGIVDQTFGLLSDLDYDLKEYVDQLRKDSGRRLNTNESSF